jgi:hypothetical protein
MKLSIIGLGKLGAPMAAVMAHKGHMVVGVDVNPACVDASNGLRSGGDLQLSSAFQGRLSYWSRPGLSQVKMEQIDFVWSGAKRGDTFEPGIRIRVCPLPGRLQVEVGLHRDDVRRRCARIPRLST